MAEKLDYRTAAYNVVLYDEHWKERVRNENKSQRYGWPYAWGFTVDQYYQLDVDLHGGAALKQPRPDPIKPIDIDAKPDTPPAKERSKFPQTTSRLIGWSQTRAPLCTNCALLQRRARPLGDIRKTFGWPANVD